jgi:hypothetical protein
MANIVAGGLIGSKVPTQFIQQFIGPEPTTTSTTTTSTTTAAPFSFASFSDDCIIDSRERLNFSVVGTLPGSYTLGVVWGETDEGTTNNWDDFSNYPGIRWTNPSAQDFTYTAFGLVSATTYYWRAKLTIGATTYWSTSQSFIKASCTTTTTTTTTTVAPGFIITIHEPLATILARTGDAVGVIAFGTDTLDLYVYDGTNWQIYENS